MSSAANDSAGFFSGGVPAKKFEKIGDAVSGVVANTERKQQVDYGTKEKLFWPDGSPRLQLAVTLKSDDPDANEDGLIRVFVKNKMVGAVAQALKDARVRPENGLEIGATLAVVYTGDGESKNGLNAPKLFAAKYQPRQDLPPDLD